MRRGDIQGLRAIAVLFVITIHSVGILRGGFAGVDIFFVVSGFVITDRLVSDAEHDGTVSLLHFYARRAQRIAPAALVTLAAVFAAAALLPQPRRASVYVDTLWAALGAGNFRMILQPTERAGGMEHMSPVVHFWSLGVEEQFYLLWPVLLLVAWTLGGRLGARRRAVLGAALAATGLSVVLAAWSVSVDTGGAYFSPAARGWELGVGVVLADLVPHLTRLTRLPRSLLAFGGLAAIEFAAVASTQEAFPLPGAVLPVLGTAAIIAAGTGGTSLVNALLGTRLLRSIGNLSYSLYLWHLPVFLFMLVLQPSGGWDVLGESLVLTFVLAWLSYRFVELPVLHMFRERSAVRTVFVGRPRVLKGSGTTG